MIIAYAGMGPKLGLMCPHAVEVLVTDSRAYYTPKVLSILVTYSRIPFEPVVAPNIVLV